MSISLKKQTTPALQSDWVETRSKKYSRLSEEKANKIKDEWFNRPEQWQKVQQGDHSLAAFSYTREELAEYPWLHKCDNLNTEPTNQPGLVLGEDLSQKLRVLELEAKQKDGSHASIFKGKNHKPYGCDGLNFRAKRSIESMGIILEQLYGKHNIGFVTLTLPWFGEELMAWISRDFAEITKRYFEKVKRYFRSIGEPFDFVRVTEIQPKRWKDKNQYALHLHYAFRSRSSRMFGEKIDKKGIKKIGKLYYLDIQTNDRLWKDSVWNSVRRYEKLNGLVQKPKIPKDWGNKMQDIRKSVAGYLSKYMSKGGLFIKEVSEWIEDKKAEGFNYELPKRWWGSSKSLCELMKKHTVPLPQKLRDWFLSLPEGRNPAPNVIYKVCPTFYSEKLQKNIILAHCGKITYKEAIKYCFKKEKKDISCHPILQVENLMKYAKAMSLGGELVKPEQCDYESHKKLGLLCPNCSNPVFLVKEKHGTSKLGKDYVVPSYFAHYNMPKNQVERCELRVKNYSEAEVKKAKAQARNQRLKFFKKWFWSILYSTKIGDNNELLGKAMEERVIWATSIPDYDNLLSEMYPVLKKIILGYKEHHLELLLEESLSMRMQYIKENREVIVRLGDYTESVNTFNAKLHNEICGEVIDFLFIKMNRELTYNLLLFCTAGIGKEKIDELTVEEDITTAIGLRIMGKLLSIIYTIPWIAKFQELK